MSPLAGLDLNSSLFRSMQENDDKENKKHPIEMTTDGALDCLFGSEIAERLKEEAGKNEPPEDSELY
jgi:hypothetical protein